MKVAEQVDGEWITYDVDPDASARVVIIPIKQKRAKKTSSTQRKKRGLFILMFGYGDLISLDRDLIVIWDDDKTFDLLPFNSPEERKMTAEEVASLKSSINKRGQREKAKSKSRQLQDKPIEFCPLEKIKVAVLRGGGRWKSYPRAALNIRLRNKAKFPSLDLLLNGETVTVESCLHAHGDAASLSLKHIFDARYQLKSAIKPDPHSIVREFLKLIGVYPNRRGGSVTRNRLTKNDMEVAIDSIRRYGSTSRVDVAAILEQEDGRKRKPSTHQITRAQKAARASH